MNQRIRLEVDKDALAKLLAEKGLSLNDFRCPDQEAKKFVWQSYLASFKSSAKLRK